MSKIINFYNDNSVNSSGLRTIHEIEETPYKLFYKQDKHCRGFFFPPLSWMFGFLVFSLFELLVLSFFVWIFLSSVLLLLGPSVPLSSLVPSFLSNPCSTGISTADCDSHPMFSFRSYVFRSFLLLCRFIEKAKEPLFTATT